VVGYGVFFLINQKKKNKKNERVPMFKPKDQWTI
jgi:hypothetical protein